MAGKVKCAIVGSGNIGTDLMIKIMRTSDVLEIGAMVGIDPDSDGLERARKLGVAATHEGMDGLVRMPVWKDIEVVFDATSAKAHEYHNELCKRDGKRMVDLTPAAIGPYCIPVVNAEEHLDKQNVNMVTCGGQATIPIVHAVRRVSQSVPYAEIVASVASKSAGPGTRANIDEFTETTAKGVEVLGGAEHGKAIIILNPAEPPLIMRDTVYAFSVGGEEEEIEKSVEDMVAAVQQYVPGYRLKQKVQFERFRGNHKLKIPELGEYEGVKVTVFLEVEGAAHYLPAYAGNLDIMTSAGLTIGERMVKHLTEAVA